MSCEDCIAVFARWLIFKTRRQRSASNEVGHGEIIVTVVAGEGGGTEK